MAKNIKKKFKPKKEGDIAKEELKSLEDLPLVGGLFKGLGKFVELVEKVEEAGGEIKRKGEIKGKEGVRGIYGFSIRTGIGERPKIQTFGNIKTVKEKTKPEFKITETREPIVDVFDEKDHILIVAELPGVLGESIKLELKGDILILEAGDEKRKYSKEILLPDKVDFEQRETNFKNGILEIKLKKI
ncbi:MAG: Hsp20/alpha crystallin family protein [bacterium]|nr:Hsp20/alpha crystallin family protein [bacterium]